MLDPKTKIRIVWPGFDCKDEEDCEEGKSGKRKEGKKGGESEEEAGDCGCCHLYPCPKWCAGVKACCVSCSEALEECPRCTCFHVGCACSKLGRALGGCLAWCLRVCGGVFSTVVACVGCVGMLLVAYFLLTVIFIAEDDKNKDKN